MRVRFVRKAKIAYQEHAAVTEAAVATVAVTNVAVIIVTGGGMKCVQVLK